jgi:hypothetical protein
MPDVGPHEKTDDGATFEKLKELQKAAVELAVNKICNCCKKEGVWIRYVFSPSDKIPIRVADWVKGTPTRNKPTDLLGGEKWNGDENVPCK